MTNNAKSQEVKNEAIAWDDYHGRALNSLIVKLILSVSGSSVVVLEWLVINYVFTNLHIYKSTNLHMSINK